MKTRIVGLFATALLFSAVSAHADPVTITGGAWVNAWMLDGGVMTLVSDRFNVSLPWDCGMNNGAGLCSFPFPSWTPGQVVNFSTTTTGSNLEGTGFNGSNLVCGAAPCSATNNVVTGQTGSPNSSFGQSTAVHPGRELQYTLRFTF